MCRHPLLAPSKADGLSGRKPECSSASRVPPDGVGVSVSVRQYFRRRMWQVVLQGNRLRLSLGAHSSISLSNALLWSVKPHYAHWERILLSSAPCEHLRV